MSDTKKNLFLELEIGFRHYNPTEVAQFGSYLKILDNFTRKKTLIEIKKNLFSETFKLIFSSICLNQKILIYYFKHFIKVLLVNKSNFTPLRKSP